MSDQNNAAAQKSRMGLVVVASSAGTVFEWYDFFIYGSVAPIIAKHFFASAGETQGYILTLLTFAAGFFARPFGSVVFGRLGDKTGRKRTFLVTITVMGVATFVAGLLPDANMIGAAAPWLLVALRVLQGFAVGGEYGGAAIYVAEHADPKKRGSATGWIQVAATFGLFLALAVILATRTILGEDAFSAWGWRIPFLLSAILLGVSIWIRLKLNESPLFKQMVEEGKQSKRPLTEAFGQWSNLKVALAALFGATAGEAVVWYGGQFYALFFLLQTLKVPSQTAWIMIAIALAIATPGFILFGWLSDKIGRKPIMLAGFALAVVTYFPIFQGITHFANPKLEHALATAPVKIGR